MRRLPLTLLVALAVLGSCNDQVEVESYNESGVPPATVQQELGQTGDPGQNPEIQQIQSNAGEPVQLNPETGGQFIPPALGTLADPQPFHDLMHQPEKAQVVDIRSSSEFAAERMDVALNAPVNDAGFVSKLSGVSKETVLLFYDNDGTQSSKAMRQAQAAGYSKVYGLKGGLQAWKAYDATSHMVGSSASTPQQPKIDVGGLDLQNYKKMSLDEWHGVMHQISNHQILDVRSEAERNLGYILESVHCDVDAIDFTSRILQLSQTVPILVYGSSAAESAKAGKILQENGYQVVYELEASYQDFANAGFGHLSTQ